MYRLARIALQGPCRHDLQYAVSSIVVSNSLNSTFAQLRRFATKGEDAKREGHPTTGSQPDTTRESCEAAAPICLGPLSCSCQQGKAVGHVLQPGSEF